MDGRNYYFKTGGESSVIVAGRKSEVGGPAYAEATAWQAEVGGQKLDVGEREKRPNAECRMVKNAEVSGRNRKPEGARVKLAKRKRRPEGRRSRKSAFAVLAA